MKGKRPRILLTGSAGALGCAIREEGCDRFDLVCVDLDPKGKSVMHRGSFTDAVLMKRLLHDCDAVIHTAALHGENLKTHTPTQFTEVNVCGLITLLELCCELEVR